MERFVKKFSFSIITLFSLLLIIGVFLFTKIPVQLFPKTARNIITVSFSWQNVSAKTIDSEVTSILEASFSSLPGIKKTGTETSNNTGKIVIEFDQDTDLKYKVYEINSVLRNLVAFLPAGVSYPEVSIGNYDPNKDPTITYAITGTNSSEADNTNIKKELSEDLEEISGIEKVEIHDPAQKILNILYNPYRMALQNITVLQLKNRISESQFTQSIGKANLAAGPTEEISVLVAERPVDDWRKMLLKVNGDKEIRLGDIATVNSEVLIPTSYYRIDGNSTINVAIFFKPNSNQIKTAEKVYDAIERFNTLNKSRFKVKVVADTTVPLRDELQNNYTRGLISLFCIVLFLLAIARSWKIVAVMAISLITTLACSFIIYYFLDVYLHIYSLAAITLSLGLIIENCYLMIGHYLKYKNLTVFLAVLGSNLSIIASISVFFFLSDRLKFQLIDFVKILIINQSVSVFVTLLFVPALLNLWSIYTASSKANPAIFSRLSLKLSLWHQYVYKAMVTNKRIVIVSLVLAFGTPLFLIPDNISGNGLLAAQYNSLTHTDFYQKFVKRPLSIVLGGSLRLFVEEVPGDNYFNLQRKTIIMVVATAPQGTRPLMINNVFVRVEKYLKKFSEIKRFETRIFNNVGRITVEFYPSYEQTSFPVELKEMLSRYLISFGNIEWKITGAGEAFDNSLQPDPGSNQIKLTGYNYDELISTTQKLKDELSKNPRVQSVNVKTGFNNNELKGHVINLNHEALILDNLSPTSISNSLSLWSNQYERIGTYKFNNEFRTVALSSSASQTFSDWDLLNNVIYAGNAPNKITRLGAINSTLVLPVIIKDNQNYIVRLSYDFIGPETLSQEYSNEVMANFKRKLPLGYLAEAERSNSLNVSEKREQIKLIVLIMLIIFSICSVVFESIVQSVAILLLIPISFIGVFLTYYLFKMEFNYGGYAAFIILSSLAVKPAIYLVNEMNILKRTNKDLNPVGLFSKAFHNKIKSLLISATCMIITLLPFIIGKNIDHFWMTFISGIMGGLVASVIGVIFILPVFIIQKHY